MIDPIKASALLKRTPGPTAIIGGNDLMAIGARKVIREHNLRVGDDIAWVVSMISP